MITCPNCNHQNPSGAVQCEACYTPLPVQTACPSCGASIQSDASFCGQCGADLRSISSPVVAVAPPPPIPVPPPPDDIDLLASDTETPDLPDLLPPEPLVEPEAILPPPPLPAEFSTPATATPDTAANATPTPPASAAPPVVPDLPPSVAAELDVAPQTRLQRNVARLLHIQTDTALELPDNVSPIRIGKPNDRVPPDIDVSGFPESEIVSRVHANIRVEGDIYYIEDVGSSNGTYVNNMPLPYGNRHRLRPGDRIALGKGDKVSFIFQLA
ncbi:MAG: FHA domain-containing protein [Cyanobacteria bacterium J06628_6]